MDDTTRVVLAIVLPMAALATFIGLEWWVFHVPKSLRYREPPTQLEEVREAAQNEEKR